MVCVHSGQKQQATLHSVNKNINPPLIWKKKKKKSIFFLVIDAPETRCVFSPWSVCYARSHRKGAVSPPSPDHHHHHQKINYTLISRKHLQVHPPGLTSMLPSSFDLARLRSYFTSSPSFTCGRRLEAPGGESTGAQTEPAPVLLPEEGGGPGRADAMDRCCIARNVPLRHAPPPRQGEEGGVGGELWPRGKGDIHPSHH